MNRLLKSERGQALIMITFAIIGMIALTGLAVDGSLAFTERRQSQNAADAAAFSAGLAYIREQDVEEAARNAAMLNGSDNDALHNVTVNHPPVDGKYAGDMEYIQVVVESTTRTAFGTVVGVNEIENRVEAVVHVELPVWDNMYSGNAVVALSPNDRGAMRSHGNNKIDVYGGGMFVNSNDDCAFQQMGNSVINSENGLHVVGDVCLNGSIDPATLINVDAHTVPYPPTNLPPEPECSEPAIQDGDTLSPGYWVGNFPPRGVIYLQPGIYCVDGMFMVNAHDTLIGDEVLIYMKDGNVHWDGKAQINLNAMSDGVYNGLLLYMPMSNDEGIIINGNAYSTFTGTMLAPASDIQLNGTMSSSTYHSQIIGYTVDLIGTADIVVNFEMEDNHRLLVQPTIELAK